MKLIQLISVSSLFQSLAFAGTEAMPSVPIAKEKKTYVIANSSEAQKLLDEQGFGKDAPMVNMMNLMMVRGSGYEGMDMTAQAEEQKSEKSEKPASTLIAVFTPNPARVGRNTLSFHSDPHLKIKGEVSMTTMDMGTDEVLFKETNPGQYEGQVAFSMAGSWLVHLSFSNGREENLDVHVKKLGN